MILFGKKIRNRYLLMADLLLIAFSVLASYLLRLELVVIFPTYQRSIFWMLGVCLFIKPLMFYLFGIYRRVWRYASIRELVQITVAVSSASMAVSVVMVILFAGNVFVGFPRSVLIIDWLLSVLLIGGLRLLFRVTAEGRSTAAELKRKVLSREKWVLIIGAGDAGVLVVRELQKNPQLNIKPIGFLDDDPEKQNHRIHDVPVLATLAELDHILESHQVDEVVIAIPSAAGKVVRMVTQSCHARGVPFRTMPGIYELLGGSVNVSRLREVEISDLLRRAPTHMDNGMVGEALHGKVVLVTGAGGSIGRELCRQISINHPAQLYLLGHGENSIFEAMLLLRENFPTIPMQPIIADIRDLNRLRSVFKTCQPQVVFHAAAHKHVPLMEMNVEEAVMNNVNGTRNVVAAAEEAGVEKLVMISTDKAVRPMNIMGATKRLAEMVVIDAARRSGKAYSVVRFGNVLGSRGSVVPLFKQQIASGGPLTITHPEMKRYFMTIPEAVHLVLQAFTLGHGGDVFVLNMGQQVKIVDLARDLIRLSGLEPDKDIEIVFSGIRPGEKLSEDLWDEGFAFSPTAHPDIYRVDSDNQPEASHLEGMITQLLEMAETGKADEIIHLMNENISGAAIHKTLPELTQID